MLVGVSINNNDWEYVTSVKYNNVDLTKLGNIQNSDDSRVEIWSLTAPDTGTHNVVVNLNEEMRDGATAGVETFMGVNQSNPLGSYNFNEDDGSIASVAVSSATDNLVFDTVCCETCDSYTVGSGQTQRWQLSADGGRVIGAGSTESGATLVNMTWTLESSDHWAIGAVSVNCLGATAIDTIAEEDWESGGWSGGSGWTNSWSHSGDSSVDTSGEHAGSYHVRLRINTGYIKRAVNLNGRTNARLLFWAKAASFESGEEAYARVSPNDVDWYTVHTWVNGDDDDEYHYFDIDLSAYSMTSEFWIAFDAEMSSTGDRFYVDDIQVVGA